MKQTLYLETTIVSYLTALPSHDLVIAAHQQVTRDWWKTRSAFELYVSQFVLDEAGAGDPEAAERRLAALADIPILDLRSDVRLVAGEILRLGGMPAKAHIDAVHVAVAAAHGVDYLLTWNCTHIANPMRRSRIEAICRAAGFEPPSSARQWSSCRSNQMPMKDPIVEEVHATREAIARESGGDLDRILAAARARQPAKNRRVVKLPPKKVPETKRAR